jgi:hypothetical protein
MATRLVSAIWVLSVLCVQHPGNATTVTIGHDSLEQTEKREAERIWDQAIEAKGGRERLYAVRNVVISSKGIYRTSHNRGNTIRQEEFYVFPDKFWAWSDYRPDVFGLRVEMVNWETKAHYLVSPDAPRDEPRGMPTGGSDQIMEGRIYYLLETKWLKPVVMKAIKGRVESRLVDIVRTKVYDQLTDFVFDRESHLLVQVRTYHGPDTSKKPADVVTFSDYTEANGLKVPRKVVFDDGMAYEVSFQFNVTYDPGVLLNPPTIEAGAEAWKPKK